MTVLVTLASGSLIGLILGLVGGGGSILAVPLLVYVVGMASPHQAVGTAAVAVALSAAISMLGHWRAGTVKWPCAATFALAGSAGALLGAGIGKAIDGDRLLSLFGLLMIGVALMMLRQRSMPSRTDVRLSRGSARHLLPRLVPTALATGILSGFFGIGGGFLVVPGLMLATAMPLANAVGTSLVAVTALGASTAASYAWSGLVDWRVAALLVAGGAVGAMAGIAAGRHLVGEKRLLETGFAAVVAAAGVLIAIKGL